jgi:gliding motility-associated protein GldM
MAHERLSPRQKMIGMMYLVLTAMLALNVSKEAVEAFKKVDKGLTLTVANYTIKNNIYYEAFNKAAEINPAKAGKFKTIAFQVKERADEAFNFIQGLKIEIINKAEGPDNLAVKGNEVNVEEVKRIDDTNVPSEVLIGANETGKANALKAMLNDYREFLITTLEGNNPTAEEALRTSLNTDDALNKDKKIERWENLNFQTLPLVAVICILSEYQVSIRNAETEVLNYLYSQIDASSYKFNRLKAIVIPVTSNYVTLGSEYEAQVFISASDTTQSPKITVGDAILPLDETGKGIYKVRASSVGPKKWGGVISLKAPDGTIVPYPFDASYTVGEPNVVVSATGMNVLYTGIDNPIDVSVPGVSPDKIKISKVTNGVVTTGRVKNPSGEFFPGNWIVKPTTPGQNAQIFVSAEINGSLQQYPPVVYRVKPLPVPVAVFAGKSSGTISRGSAVAAQGVFATMPDFDFQLVYNITGFTVLYSDRGEDFELKSASSNLTPQQKDLINRLTRGKNLFFKDIRAVGPDGRPKDLPPIVLKIE